jgi:flagellar motor switch protein FliM
MSEVLSQSEIDALLSALTSGEVKAEDIRDADQASRIRNYDFRRAMRFSKDHIRIISRIHEHFCRLMSTYLSGQLRSVVQIQVESVDQVPYEEFIRSIPVLTVIQVYAFHPLEGKVVIETSPQIVFAILDRLMGGSISGSYKERELTDIEQALVKRIFSRTAEFLSDAWHNVTQLEPEFVSMESNPQFLQLTTPNETVLVITLSAKVGEASGLINMCIPHVTVEPIMPRLSTQYFMDGTKEKQKNKQIGEHMEQHVRNVAVNISVELGSSELTVEDVLGMQIGDTITLRQTIRDPVVVYVDGVPAYSASLGKLKNRYAVKIIEDWSEVNADDGQREVIPGRD